VKRGSSAKPPCLPRSPGARRLLSEDERRLWDSVAKQVKPLRHARIALQAHADGAPATAGHKHRKEAAPATIPQSAAVRRGPAVAPLPSLAPLGRRERQHLSRGRTEIDARLDLHGMTQARAHRRLLQFLHHASGEGFRFVLVITGKGGTTGNGLERGVLRRQVPEWLSQPEFRALIVGFEEAHIAHGGAGALYVRIRRAR